MVNSDKHKELNLSFNTCIAAVILKLVNGFYIFEENRMKRHDCDQKLGVKENSWGRVRFRSLIIKLGRFVRIINVKKQGIIGRR